MFVLLVFVSFLSFFAQTGLLWVRNLNFWIQFTSFCGAPRVSPEFLCVGQNFFEFLIELPKLRVRVRSRLAVVARELNCCGGGGGVCVCGCVGG